MSKLQVRRDDQSRYHNLKPPSSLGSGWNEIHCPPAVTIRIRSFTSVQMFHTHTHTPRQAGLKTEVPTVRWRWGWQGDESEMRMKMGWKLLNRNTRRGTPKRRGGTKREHQHQHTLPGAGEPWKGKGKEKAEADGRTQRQAEGGRTDAPEPT